MEFTLYSLALKDGASAVHSVGASYTVTHFLSEVYKYPNSSSVSEVMQDDFTRTNSLSGRCGNKSHLSYTDLII